MPHETHSRTYITMNDTSSESSNILESVASPEGRDLKPPKIQIHIKGKKK